MAGLTVCTTVELYINHPHKPCRVDFPLALLVSAPHFDLLRRLIRAAHILSLRTW
jgi:hypothetical protein